MIIKEFVCYICGFKQEKHNLGWIKIKKSVCNYATDGWLRWDREHICPRCIKKIQKTVEVVKERQVNNEREV